MSDERAQSEPLGRYPVAIQRLGIPGMLPTTVSRSALRSDADPELVCPIPSIHRGSALPSLGAMDDSFNSGVRFLMAEARLVERRLFATCLGGAPPAGVVDALRGYQNDDGGFGHGLEPDTLCPASLPIYAEIGRASCRERVLRLV